MHLMIPFASVQAEAGRHAMGELALPALDRLLRRWQPVETLGHDEFSLSPPHELALAQAIGWSVDDGRLPWAARSAAADGLAPGQAPWALLTPTHWRATADQITLLDPAVLALSDEESRALLDAVRELFESEGWTLAWGAADRWYAAHEQLDGLALASLDRVIGRNVDLWLGDGRDADRRLILVRRLQSEVQMLLHAHPVNEARESRGALPVNSFWLSGGGRHRPDAAPAPVLDERLRAPALHDDWAAWAEAWRALDAGPIAALETAGGTAADASLTLCGERHATRYAPAADGWWQGLRRRLGASPRGAAVLESL